LSPFVAVIMQTRGPTSDKIQAPAPGPSLGKPIFFRKNPTTVGNGATAGVVNALPFDGVTVAFRPEARIKNIGKKRDNWRMAPLPSVV